MLKNIGDGATTPAGNGSPVFLLQVTKISKQRMRGITIEGLFDEPRKRINDNMLA